MKSLPAVPLRLLPDMPEVGVTEFSTGIGELSCTLARNDGASRLIAPLRHPRQVLTHLGPQYFAIAGSSYTFHFGRNVENCALRTAVGNIFVTGRIPEQGIALLSEAGHAVEVWDEDGPIPRSAPVTQSIRLLGGAFLLLAVTVSYSAWLGSQGRPLQNVASYPGGPVVAPRGGLSLQMPMSTGAASEIVRTWSATRLATF